MKVRKPSPRLKTIFWLEIVLFVLLFAFMMVPAFYSDLRESFKDYFAPVFFSLAGLYFLLGGVLIWQTKKEKISGKLQKSLVLTGASAVGFLASVILHNLFYALWVVTKDIVWLSYLMEGLHAAFFIVAIFVCPIGFFIGALVGIILLTRK